MKALEFKKELFSQELLQARRRGHRYYAKALGSPRLRTSKDRDGCLKQAIKDSQRIMKKLGIIGELPQVQDGEL